MKKQLLILSFATLSVIATAQTTRMSLYEEFTGETCPPCAATNPGLDALLKSGTNPNKIIPIKWQVPIPSAPTPTWSLYKTNQAEIDWRFKTTAAGGYGYGISSAPSSRIDGQNATVFGAASDHPANLNTTVINTAASYTSPFSISMSRAWDPTFTSVTLTVNIQASANFTSVGALVFRLCMIEQEIKFATQPGTNGEKDFNWVVRKSFPTLQTGTSMVSSWTTGQTQTFTINCVLPSYIVDKSEIAFVGFIQDDGNRQVKQAARTSTVGLTNDAKATAVTIPAVVCTTTLNPQITILNNGTNAITSMTINPTLDATPQTPYNWTGSLAPGASTVITMNMVTTTAGSHTYSYNITSVSGTDLNTANNTAKTGFAVSPSTFLAPITEPFTTATFPPTNWNLYNPDAGANTWSRQGTANAYVTTPAGALRYYGWNNSVTGDIDDLILPPLDMTGISAPVLSFDHSHARYSTSYTDKLEVFVSTNCGTSWTSLFNKSGATLATAPTTTANFVPSITQWTTNVIPVPTAANQPQVLVKFTVTNGYGNNIWVDNVNLGGPTSIAKAQLAQVNFEVYPNPAQNEANVRIIAINDGEYTISILNSLGQLMSNKKVNVQSGDNNYTFDTQNLAEGFYHVVMADKSGNTTVKKLTISK
ncbi:MAG: T9SS type A sorting domain-containing protein [Sphingobacteriaceae bacterium]|nr:T9SS type A sorting domain-containing protein [Sphingobacteriaceae bacterium]